VNGYRRDEYLPKEFPPYIEIIPIMYSNCTSLELSILLALCAGIVVLNLKIRRSRMSTP
jgi:hypothetical protein